MAKDVLTDNPQVAAQLRQLLAERENAVAYGQTTRVEAVDKQLATLGYKTEKQAAKAVDAKATEEPQGRKAPAKHTTAQDGKK
jgi:hypothetical protein